MIEQLKQNDMNFKQFMQHLEIRLIYEALAEHSGVVTHTAKTLKMGTNTLMAKMRRYKIPRNRAGRLRIHGEMPL